jgi:hypothetical protein
VGSFGLSLSLLDDVEGRGRGVGDETRGVVGDFARGGGEAGRVSATGESTFAMAGEEGGNGWGGEV